MEEEKIEYLIFCVEILKEALNMSGAEVYRLLEDFMVKQDIYDGYEEFHSFGKEYMTNFLIDSLKARGAKI